jgi:hypothetical protein
MAQNMIKLLRRYPRLRDLNTGITWLGTSPPNAFLECAIAVRSCIDRGRFIILIPINQLKHDMRECCVELQDGMLAKSLFENQDQADVYALNAYVHDDFTRKSIVASMSMAAAKWVH